MLGIEDYGSDVESGDESFIKTATTTTQAHSQPTLGTSTSSLLAKLPPPTSKSTLALPPPKSSSSSLTLPESSSSASSSTTQTPTPSGAALPKKRTKKIAINLPAPEDDEEDGPLAKRPRVAPGAGAGMSSLLGMLPAPKRPAVVVEKKAERVLGGGGGPGLVFRTSKSETRRFDAVDVEGPLDTDDAGREGEVQGPTDIPGPSTAFVPPSLKKGKPNISLEDQESSRAPISSPTRAQKSAAPAVDIFSLGIGASAKSTPTPSTSSTPAISSVPSTSTAASSPFTISSAPLVSTFRPPSPTLDDPYPGYYQLPSGAYAPYDADYYASYAKRWKDDYDKHIRALEKAQYEPDADGAQSVDMAAEMDKARREIKAREDRKALTMPGAGQGENGEQAMPRMNVQGAKLGAVARSRHQLTTLLTEAYLNRETLEEKLAQGRRNRKEAGMKYGF